ncbi:helix-turn-helix domain-containing protein [Chryseobacterium carnipullorum]|uniref:Helix-turn-helix domain-containing protein n=1 Tax=Chryseobacterium carnipullorum TaxID=1124835 RepID=A0A1M7C7J5_CHRCU|nr:helix-turn-helix domain-containing protein [Chryseobacterium carnipullorum]MDN5479218.1 helix-turn-helix domain-containing protein [Chryseobacterium sp.]AZA47448.1 helix-turn-helix domain-containing protein [Chryseobacterium carnipullorum]AZA66786.1 helix-turn-helix domain-containing protein [Chryseobacterium carnipullorum]SHL63106.1 hypothetical protein SAMN05444360_103114 [Chryseobacterium carnipullorum]STD10013.1 Uncharacterised protein [Chryseobacterium carnipullorum]
MEKSGPDYKKIYTDIILKKHPGKYALCSSILQKKVLSVLDVIKLNQLIFSFEDLETSLFNQKHKSYDKDTILEILDYQKKNGYTNKQVADEFRLSRNSVAKWKKIFSK